MPSNATLGLEANWRGRGWGCGGNNHGLRGVSSGENVTSRSGHGDCGGAYRNAREGIVAKRIGNCGVHHAKGIGQGNNYASQIRISFGLQTVSIEVTEHVAINGALGLETNRSCRSSHTGSNRDGLGNVGRGDNVGRRASNRDGGCADGQVGKAVVAGGIGGGGVDYAERIRQRDSDATQIRLACSLDSVSAYVIKHLTGYCTLRLETNGRGWSRGAGGNSYRLRVIVGGEDVASRISHIDRCRSGGDTTEDVVAVGISCCGVHNTINISQANAKST